MAGDHQGVRGEGGLTAGSMSIAVPPPSDPAAGAGVPSTSGNEVGALYDAAHDATAAGDQAAAIALCERALSLQPSHPGVLELLGFLRSHEKRWPEAIQLLQAARNAGGDNAELLNHLATAYYRSGDVRNAGGALAAALRLDPDYADTHLHFASLLLELRQFGPARKHAERALAIDPRRYECLVGMGNLCRAEDRCAEALSFFAEAESVSPERIEAPMNIGVVHQEMGLPREAIAAFERVLRRHPHHPEVLSNRLFTMNYLPEWNPDYWFEQHRAYERAIDVPEQAPRMPGPSSAPGVPPLSAAGGDDRRVRLGYVSADLRNHAVARFLLPVLRQHDSARFHVTCYYNGRIADYVTREIAGLCHAFRPVADLDDRQLLTQIRADAIDVLVDLSGHSSGNRLPVFAAGAAPVQVTWLGYLGSTGVSAMRYRITDAIADPAGASDAWHTERLLRLETCLWAYEPYAAAPHVAPLPALTNGCVTFGALSNPAKVSDAALRAWATVLRQVPASKLVLMGRDDPMVRERFLRPFLEAGIDAGRIAILSRLSTRDYLQAWNTIDIGFDPFPYSGGTTVCDALFQGVPVIALHSIRPFGGSAATVLHQVGLDDWVADSAPALIDLAVRKSSLANMPALRELRRTLRSRMQASPLCDAAGFTRRFEAALLAAR